MADNTFQTGLCSCFDDMEICCYAFQMPIFAQATAYRMATGNDWCATCMLGQFLGPIVTCCLRTKMREAYGIKGNCCLDCMITWFCFNCVVAQMYQEAKKRGPAPNAMK
jgi:Cys-rich protein (TIGR01571 family)